LNTLPIDRLAHGLKCRVLQPLASHQCHGVTNRCERIAKFVSEHCDELVHSLGRIGQCLGVTAFGQILCDFREAAGPTVGIAQRGNHRTRPK
jgi:hypothetical protein